MTISPPQLESATSQSSYSNRIMNIKSLIHHKALSVLLYLAGSLTQFPGLQLAGLPMVGHSSFDRALGLALQGSTPKGN
jgi:hypothetical protein